MNIETVSTICGIIVAVNGVFLFPLFQFNIKLEKRLTRIETKLGIDTE